MLGRVKQLLFHNTTIRQTVAKNTFWLAVSNFGGRLLRAIIIIYSARVLGAAEWGLFSYALTIVAFLTIFIDIGINHIVTREASKLPAGPRRTEFISTAFIIKVGLLILGVLVVLFVAPDITTLPGAAVLFPIVAFILASDSLRDFGSAIFRASERMEWEAWLAMITNGAIVIFGFIFLAISPTVRFFAYSYAAGSLVGTVATFYALRKDIRGIATNFTRSLMRPLFTAAWPFAISGLLGALLLNTDIILIGWFRSATDVGLYSAAQRIIQVLYIIPSILAMSVLPLFSRLANQSDTARHRSVFEQTMSLALLVAIPAAVGGFLLGLPIMQLVFGGEYVPATASFKILMLTMAVDFPAVILANAIFSFNRQKSLILYAAIGGIGNVVFDLLLIPRYGITGSAFATLLAQCMSNAYLWRAMRSTYPFHVFPRLHKMLLATAGMAILVVLCMVVGLPVIITIALASLAYIGLLYALREPLVKDAWSLLRAKAPLEAAAD
jgi:O-antigen/teichoic acid export membrane protein